VPRAAHSMATLSVKCSGIGPTCKPAMSLICSVAITVAIPVVKPVVTGCGMYWMSLPIRAMPIATSINPAMNPAVSSPVSPWADTIGARMTTNAAVGPVTWNLLPPSSATSAPAKIAV
jgi:hypothetical protein